MKCNVVYQKYVVSWISTSICFNLVWFRTFYSGVIFNYIVQLADTGGFAHMMF